MLNWFLVEGPETIKKFCTLHFSSKPDTCASPVTIVKPHAKKMSNLFSSDYFTTCCSIVKCYWNVNFEEIDTEPSKGKNDGPW